jgi:RimJ/RimL family protein N-acetyltransferase
MLTTDVLQTNRVRLGIITDDDLPTIGRWYQDITFLRLLDARVAALQRESELREWIDGSYKSSTAYLFGIRLIDNDALIGYLELEGILWNHGTAWLAIGIGEAEARGKGYGYEAIQMALSYAFGELNLHRVQLTVFSYNVPAIALYEKLGFQREGTYREMLHRDGQRYDMFLYGILRHEWQNQTGRA